MEDDPRQRLVEIETALVDAVTNEDFATIGRLARQRDVLRSAMARDEALDDYIDVLDAILRELGEQ